MNVSYFDLTNDLKCNILSPTNCIAIKAEYLTEILLGKITLVRLILFKNGIKPVLGT